VRAFFQMCLDKMVAERVPLNTAAEVLSTITGALVVANALGDPTAYDRAIGDLLRQRKPWPRRGSQNSAHVRGVQKGASRRALKRTPPPA
jgi:TetR/AcrR family transcriptional repressor of nem operon